MKTQNQSRLLSAASLALSIAIVAGATAAFSGPGEASGAYNAYVAETAAAEITKAAAPQYLEKTASINAADGIDADEGISSGALGAVQPLRAASDRSQRGAVLLAAVQQRVLPRIQRRDPLLLFGQHTPQRTHVHALLVAPQLLQVRLLGGQRLHLGAPVFDLPAQTPALRVRAQGSAPALFIAESAVAEAIFKEISRFLRRRAALLQGRVKRV